MEVYGWKPRKYKVRAEPFSIGFLAYLTDKY